MPKKFVFNGPSFSCFLDCDYCSHYLEKKKDIAKFIRALVSLTVVIICKKKKN